MEMPEHNDVTIRDIAAKVGCSHASVSRALRNEAKVGAELREKILKTAKEMGYRPNPLLASLMATHNKRNQRSKVSANLAWLNTHPNPRFWHIYAHNRRYFEAANARATELGYGFDEVWTGEKGLTGARLISILKARGIYGLLIPGSCVSMAEDFDWSYFSVACIGDQLAGQKQWHRAGVSARHNVEVAFERLKELKYKKIALALASQFRMPEVAADLEAFHSSYAKNDHFLNSNAMKRQLAGYYYSQQFVAPSDRIRPFIYHREADDFIRTLSRWIEQEKPDAIIGNDVMLLEAVTQAGLRVPEDIGIAHLNLADDVADWAGMDIHPERQAHAAIDLLSAQVERNERGLPPYPKFIHIDGEWKAGWTVRDE